MSDTKKQDRHEASWDPSNPGELNRVLFEEAADGIFIIDPDGRCVVVNPRGTELTGYSREELLGMNITDLIPPEDFARDPMRMDELRQGRMVTNECRIRRKDGSLLLVEVIVRMLPGGNLLDMMRDITDRKRTESVSDQCAEMELRESEEKYRRLVETTGTGYLIIDDQGRVTDANQQYVHLTGRQGLEDVIGHSVLEWTAPHDLERNASEVRRCIEQGFVRNLEIDYVTPSGQVIPIEINATVLRASGTLRILALCRDIIERKQAEEERKAHIRFLESLERIDQAIKLETDVEQMLRHIIKTEFSIFDCDRAWLLYPCDPDAPSFRVPMEITRPEYPGAMVLNVDVPMSPELAQNLREALEADEPVTYIAGTERPINKQTTEQFGVQSQMIVPVYPKLGKPWVFGMHQCSYPRIWTKEEKKLFTEIARRTSDGLSSVLFLRELQENEQRFRSTFEQAAVGIAHVAPDGRWLRVNQKLCDIVGYSREELLQKTFPDITYPEDLDASMEYVRQALAGEIPTYSMEKRYIRKDGSLVWINLTVSVVRNVSGDPTYFIAVIEDIVKRKKAEEDKQNLQGQLFQAQKMESVGQLAGGVAHDFNNMLAAILGHAELAMMRCLPSEPIHADLKVIVDSARRSADLTRQLLAFARKQTVAPKVLDVNHTVAGMLKMLLRLIGEDIEFAWVPGAGLWSVKIDPSQIDQILANLCVNARDAIVGVGKVTIETKNTAFDEDYCAVHPGFSCGEYVMLAVSDDGCGMGKEILDRLFEPFFTTKEVGKGTGLGLATVYGIVKQNEGFINVNSEPGKGTTFKIYLPRFVGKAMEPTAESTAETPRGRGETMLLVEDEAVILSLGKAMLERLGYTVLTAGTPGEALRQAKAHTAEIKLLITDVVMPEMNGRDLTKLINNIKPGLKCLFTSGYTANVIAHHGVLDEGLNFLQKPFSMKELASKVRQALNGENHCGPSR